MVLDDNQVLVLKIFNLKVRNETPNEVGKIYSNTHEL